MRKPALAAAAALLLAPALASAEPWVDVPRGDRYATALPPADDEPAPDDDEAGVPQANAAPVAGAESGKGWADVPRRNPVDRR